MKYVLIYVVPCANKRSAGEMRKHHYQKEVFGSLMEVRGPFFSCILPASSMCRPAMDTCKGESFQVLCSGWALAAIFLCLFITGTLGVIAFMCV